MLLCHLNDNLYSYQLTYNLKQKYFLIYVLNLDKQWYMVINSKMKKLLLAGALLLATGVCEDNWRLNQFLQNADKNGDGLISKQ